MVFSARPIDDPELAAPTSPEIVELAWFPSDGLPQLQHEAASALVALARARGRATVSDIPGMKGGWTGAPASPLD